MKRRIWTDGLRPELAARAYARMIEELVTMRQLLETRGGVGSHFEPEPAIWAVLRGQAGNVCRWGELGLLAWEGKDRAHMEAVASLLGGCVWNYEPPRTRSEVVGSTAFFAAALWRLAKSYAETPRTEGQALVLWETTCGMEALAALAIGRVRLSVLASRPLEQRAMQVTDELDLVYRTARAEMASVPKCEAYAGAWEA